MARKNREESAIGEIAPILRRIAFLAYAHTAVGNYLGAFERPQDRLPRPGVALGIHDRVERPFYVFGSNRPAVGPARAVVEHEHELAPVVGNAPAPRKPWLELERIAVHRQQILVHEIEGHARIRIVVDIRVETLRPLGAVEADGAALYRPRTCGRIAFLVPAVGRKPHCGYKR